MMQHARLEPRFVEHVPERLEPGHLYVSMAYATALHSCCCGCGEEVVTPFTPTGWRMTFDGESVSLHPSVGNWNQPCRSHYVIDRGRVIDAGPPVEVGSPRAMGHGGQDQPAPVLRDDDAKKPGLLKRLWRRIVGS